MANKSIGGIWKHKSEKGTWLSISIEIDGVKHNFVAFANSYKKEGDNRPDFNIQPARERAQPQPSAPSSDDESVPF